MHGLATCGVDALTLDHPPSTVLMVTAILVAKRSPANLAVFRVHATRIRFHGPRSSIRTSANHYQAATALKRVQGAACGDENGPRQPWNWIATHTRPASSLSSCIFPSGESVRQPFGFALSYETSHQCEHNEEGTKWVPILNTHH
eukprot:SAG31_NODE_3812_length_3860_cov_1.918107_3_plen_145_part_00